MPTCYCLLSFCSSFTLFSQLLDVVELKLGEGDNSIYTFLHSVLAQPFPDPGETVIARTFSIVTNEKGEEDCKPEVFRLTRTNSEYEYLEHVNFNPLFSKLDVSIMVMIFRCLLLEYKILVMSESISTLSSCVNAIANMGYPFLWQYVFIPILPQSMLSFLAAPMPFLMGILSNCMENIHQDEMDHDVLIVDLDNNIYIKKPQNIPDIMPPSLTQSLLKVFKLVKESNLTGLEYNIPVSHTLIRFFHGIFGTYSKYIKEADGEFYFDDERFLKGKSTEIKKFFNEFKQTQQFMCFMDERLNWTKKGLLHYCPLLNIDKDDIKKKIYEKLRPRSKSIPRMKVGIAQIFKQDKQKLTNKNTSSSERNTIQVLEGKQEESDGSESSGKLSSSSFETAPSISRYDMEIKSLFYNEAISDMLLVSNDGQRLLVYSSVIYTYLPNLQVTTQKGRKQSKIDLPYNILSCLLSWILYGETDYGVLSKKDAIQFLTFDDRNEKLYATKAEYLMYIYNNLSIENALYYVELLNDFSDLGRYLKSLLNLSKAFILNGLKHMSSNEIVDKLSKTSVTVLYELYNLMAQCKTYSASDLFIESVETDINSKYERFLALYNSKKYCDVKLQIYSFTKNGERKIEEFDIHRGIVAARSSYFLKRLKPHIPVIRLPRLKFDSGAFHLILEFIYTDTIRRIPSDGRLVSELLNIAKKLKLDRKRLLFVIESNLINKLTLDLWQEFFTRVSVEDHSNMRVLKYLLEIKAKLHSGVDSDLLPVAHAMCYLMKNGALETPLDSVL